jgi:hypothetical protein
MLDIQQRFSSQAMMSCKNDWRNPNAARPPLFPPPWSVEVAKAHCRFGRVVSTIGWLVAATDKFRLGPWTRKEPQTKSSRQS